MIACPIGGRVRTQIGGYTRNGSWLSTGQGGVYGVKCRRYMLYDGSQVQRNLEAQRLLKVKPPELNLLTTATDLTTTTNLVGRRLEQTVAKGVRLSRG